MIDVIQSCIKSFRIINDCIGGYTDVLDWLTARLAEVWQDRGAFPGLGEMFCALGVPLGVVIAKDIREKYDDTQGDFWTYIDSVIDAPEKYLDKNLSKGISPIIKTAWKKMKPERKDLFQLLSRFALILPQAETLFETSCRVQAGIECSDKDILEKQYFLYLKFVKNIRLPNLLL